MNLGRELYAGSSRYRKPMLFLFAGIGIFASVSILALVLDIGMIGYLGMSVPSFLIPCALISFNKAAEKLDLRQICMFSLVNVVLLLLLALAI